MIKIKNHIYNENEIISINESTENDSISIKFKTDSYFILENATFDNIEWNYENNNEYCNVFYEDRIEELKEENKKLKEQVGQFSNTINELGRANVNIQRIITKAIEYLKHEQFKRIILGFGKNKYLEKIKEETIKLIVRDVTEYQVKKNIEEMYKKINQILGTCDEDNEE